jgi:putative ABC transport system permease protein
MNIFRRRKDQDLDEEIQAHLRMAARDLGDARAARKEFGNVELVKEITRDTWRGNSLDSLFKDVSFALRGLRKTPLFTAAAILTLALGLGMNTAIFSAVNAVILRSLQYQDPSRLVSLWEEVSPQVRDNSSSGGTLGGHTPHRSSVSVANLVDYREGRAFSDLAGDAVTSMNLTDEGTPERIYGENVTANFFPVLGVQPTLGRGFLKEDDQVGHDQVLILTSEFCQRKFGGTDGVLGRHLLLDGNSFEVVGILPSGFQSPRQMNFADRIDFYKPAGYSKTLLTSHGDHEIIVIGRLAPGVSMPAAQAELDAISAGLAQRFPDSNKGTRSLIAPLRDDLIRSVSRSLWVLLGATGLIVLIACVNVANLVLIRAVSRRHETSVRLALGASRGRIFRQFLVESLIIAGAGCATGVIIGGWLLRGLVMLAPAGIPRVDQAGLDSRVLAVSALLALLTGLLFGLAPAWQAIRTAPSRSLKTSERNSSDPAQLRWRAALTVTEIALSVILLIGAGLLLKSFIRLQGVDLGFQPDRVLAMNINLPDKAYPAALQRLQFFEQLEERVKTIPGVQSVAYANRFPMRGGWGGSVMVEGSELNEDADLQAVSPGYFETLGISLLRGRLFSGADRTGELNVAVVNQAFVRQFLAGRDPIGHRIQRPHGEWSTIVGLVNDIRRDGKAGEIRSAAYLPAAQTGLYPVLLADFAVRTDGDPKRLTQELQRVVWTLDRNQPVTNVRTLTEVMSASAAQRRFQTLLLMVFAFVAVSLTTIGVFGVLSYSVTQRTCELGIRVALGAQPSQIAGLILRQAAALIAAGTALGIVGALALTRYVQSLLFEVGSHDAMTHAAAVALLVATALLAAWIPARRGGRVDPVIALRNE